MRTEDERSPTSPTCYYSMEPVNVMEMVYSNIGLQSHYNSFPSVHWTHYSTDDAIPQVPVPLEVHHQGQTGNFLIFEQVYRLLCPFPVPRKKSFRS